MIFILVLKKSIKSLQLILNESFIQKYIGRTISSSAYSQARKKLKHTAFIELNEEAIRILAIELLNESNDSPEHSNRDLLIYDRLYGSYEFMAHLIHHKKDFVIRCKSNSFTSVTKSFYSGQGPWSKIVTLKAPSNKRKALEEQALLSEITVRFVSVILDTGEIEILVTSLMEPSIKRTQFKKLYFLRWGIEGFFNLIKDRLNLEHFTGKSVESVKQDFWSTVFITNVETIFTEETEEEVNCNLKEGLLPKKLIRQFPLMQLKTWPLNSFTISTINQI